MARRSNSLSRPLSSERLSADAPNTRQQLLEVAGQIFAEKGYDRATGKEICEQAGTNAAAINYHFGGMEGLYAAALEEAHGRLVTLEALSAAIAGQDSAADKLKAVTELVVQTLAGPVSTSWVMKIIGREIIAPSPALGWLRDKQLLPKARIFKAIISDYMGLPEDHPAVARGAMNVMAPWALLMMGDQRSLKGAFPELGFGPSDSGGLVAHLVRFALAGLAAAAAAARAEPAGS